MCKKIEPMCWNCASAVIEPTPNSELRAKRMVGCLEDDTIKSFEDAQTKCPWLGEREDECTRQLVVNVPLDMPYDLFLDLYERGIRELPKELIVAAYAQWKLPQMLERLSDDDREESDRPETGEDGEGDT